MKSVKGYLLILGATLFWGVSATIAKLLFTEQVDVLVLVQMRMTLSCIVLWMIFLVIRPSVIRVRWKDLYRFALMGIIGGAGSNFTYYYTIQQTNVATAILLQYMAPLLVLIYAGFSREEGITVPKIVAGVISLAGCFLAMGGSGGEVQSIGRIGLMMGIASAFCWAFANVWLRRLLNTYNPWTCILYTFASASIFWMFVNPPWHMVTAGYSAQTWGTFFIFAMMSILIPHSLYFLGVRRLTASRAIITATSEPVFAILSAYILIGEILTPVQILGAVFVVIAIATLQIRQEESRHDNVPIPIPPAE
jgi:drug/metabolite transporter (DMT)-like permease